MEKRSKVEHSSKVDWKLSNSLECLPFSFTHTNIYFPEKPTNSEIELFLVKQQFLNDEIVKMIEVVLSLIKSQKKTLPAEFYEKITDSCVEFLSEGCCENPNLVNSNYVNIEGRLCEMLHCESCGKVFRKTEC